MTKVKFRRGVLKIVGVLLNGFLKEIQDDQKRLLTIVSDILGSQEIAFLKTTTTESTLRKSKNFNYLFFNSSMVSTELFQDDLFVFYHKKLIN